MTRFDHDDDADLVAVIEDATQQAFRKGLDAGEAKGHAKGFADGQRALRDALAIVAKLNGSTHKVLKALEADEPEPDADHLDAMPEDARRLLAAAMLDVAIKHAENDTDPTAGLGSLVDLAYDPGELQDLIDGGGDVIAKAFTSSVVVKAWDADLHPRADNGRFISKEKLQAAKSDPKKAKQLLDQTTRPEERAKLEKVLAGKADPGHTKRSQARADAAGRRASREESAKRAYKIATDAMVGDASPEHFEELATHLPNLTVAQLKDIRAALGLGVSGKTKQAIVARLVDHAGRVASGELPASQDRPEPEPKAPRVPKPGAVKSVHPSELHVDPSRFQFKLNTNNPAGVTDELKAVKTWNPDFAGVISVWRDPADGKTYVVNGHHRHELATRLGAKNLAIRYIDAANAQEARAIGALVNIAEGRGTAIDAAKFMRDKGLPIDDFAKYGVTLKAGALADQAQTLTKLNPRAFHRLSLGQLDVNKALAVAKHLENPERQEKLFKLLDKRREEGKDIGTKTVEEMARTMNAVKDATTTTSTLWGPEENSEDTFVHRADLAQSIRAELASDVTDFEVVASERRAGKISGAGNVLAVGENKQRADAAEKAKNVFDALANRSGPVADALNDGAVKLAQAKTDKERKRARFETGEAVREAIDRELGTADRGAKSPAIPASAEPGEPADVGAADAGRGEAEPGGLTPPAKPARDNSFLSPDAQLDIFGGKSRKPRPAKPAVQNSLIPRGVEAKDDAARMERALDAMRRAGNPEEAAPAPVAATSAPAAPAPTPVASMSPKEFADAVHQIANAETRGYGNNKVFISDVFDGLKKRDPSLTLGEFKRRLLDAHGDRDLGLTLSRADLAQVMHPDDVSRSEIVHPHFSGVNFHFVQTPEQKPRTNRGPDGGIHSNPASVPSAPAPPPAAAFSASPTR